MSRLSWTYLAAGGVLVATYWFAPTAPAQDVLYALVGLLGVVGVLVGVRRHRPRRAAAWSWMATGLGLWVVGDAVFSVYADVLHVDAFPSPADAVYLLGYPVVAVGFVLLVRPRRQRRDLRALVDSGIVTVSLGLVAWVVLATPVVEAGGSSVLEVVVGVSYPAADIVLLAMMVYLLITPRARTASFRLLTAAAVLMLVADTAFSLASAAGLDVGVLDLLWLGSYVTWGAAALHDSMRTLSDDDGAERSGFGRGRLGALAAAVLVAPTTLGVQLATDAPLAGWAVVVASVLVSALVIARMQVTIDEIRRATVERERLQDDLVHQAAHDSLTEIANRSSSLDLVQAALDRARESGGAVALLLVDLDGFKLVNDTAGHRAGDDVLRETTRRLKEAVGPGHPVGRLGGDEFVVVVEHERTLEGSTAVLALAAEVVDAMSLPWAVRDRGLDVGASVGVALSGDDALDAAQLVREADVAAHRAKSAGGSRVHVFDDDLRRELAERSDLETAIRGGLHRGEFLLHYQPVVRLPSLEVKGFEALVRWDRPGHGLVPPDRFIPVAEESSLICELDRWVLREAAAQLAAWTGPGVGPADAVSVAVNVSGRHLADPAIVDDVRDVLSASGVHPASLVLEITETVLVDVPTAVTHLDRLRELGVRISIDDFGTGYTSIGQLRALRADTLKIDRSLVASTAPGSAELVSLVVHAAHAVGLAVVAEGVELEEQVAFLARAGCDAAQGYLFARPAPAADVVRGALSPAVVS